ncbi:hypothetical protein HQ520_00610 [bacterium]|nr:hypothetical protein [bacterium]
MTQPTLIATTICRQAGSHEPSGYVYTVNPTEWTVLSRARIPEPPGRERDPNPRGGLRGGRGIAIGEGEVFIANNSAVFRYGPEWRLRGEITHPSCASIHDIAWRNDSLWVTSSFNDLVLRFSPEGRIQDFLNLREKEDLLRDYGFRKRNLLTRGKILEGQEDFRVPRAGRLERYDGLHVNSLAFLPDGEMLLSLGLIHSRSHQRRMAMKDFLLNWGLWNPFVTANRWAGVLFGLRKEMHTDLVVKQAMSCSVILRFDSKGDARPALVFPKSTAAIHSLLVGPDGAAFIGDTTTGDIVRFDPDRAAETGRLHVTERFLRGIEPLPSGELVAGAQNELIRVDFEGGRVAGRIRLSEDEREAVYDIQTLPEGFGPLPEQLPG